MLNLTFNNNNLMKQGTNFIKNKSEFLKKCLAKTKKFKFLFIFHYQKFVNHFSLSFKSFSMKFIQEIVYKTVKNMQFSANSMFVQLFQGKGMPF